MKKNQREKSISPSNGPSLFKLLTFVKKFGESESSGRTDDELFQRFQARLAIRKLMEEKKNKKRILLQTGDR
jgi:hypothetical protein